MRTHSQHIFDILIPIQNVAENQNDTSTTRVADDNNVPSNAAIFLAGTDVGHHSGSESDIEYEEEEEVVEEEDVGADTAREAVVCTKSESKLVIIEEPNETTTITETSEATTVPGDKKVIEIERTTNGVERSARDIGTKIIKQLDIDEADTEDDAEAEESGEGEEDEIDENDEEVEDEGGEDEKKKQPSKIPVVEEVHELNDSTGTDEKLQPLLNESMSTLRIDEKSPRTEISPQTGEKEETPTPISAQPIPAQPISAESIPAQAIAPQPLPAQPISAQPITSQPIPAKPIPAQPITSQPITAQPTPLQPITANDLQIQQENLKEQLRGIVLDIDRGLVQTEINKNAYLPAYITPTPLQLPVSAPISTFRSLQSCHPILNDCSSSTVTTQIFKKTTTNLSPAPYQYQVCQLQIHISTLIN